VQPNPATDRLMITVQGIAPVQVVDVMGQIAWSGTITNSETINVSRFSRGVYYVLAHGAKAVPVVVN
jgi:hypothetical protein